MNATIANVLSAIAGFAIGSFFYEALFKNLFTNLDPNWIHLAERTFFFSMGVVGITIIYKLNGVLRDE